MIPNLSTILLPVDLTADFEEALFFSVVFLPFSLSSLEADAFLAAEADAESAALFFPTEDFILEDFFAEDFSAPSFR